MGTNTSPRVVKFVESDESGLPLKRKQVPQACDECRKRKKRCTHADEPDSRPEGAKRRKTLTQKIAVTLVSASSSQGKVPIVLGEVESQAEDELATDLDHDPEAEEDDGRPAATSRFVGDLNPEGMFAEANLARTNRERARGGDVGIWLSSARTKKPSAAPMPSILDRVLLPVVRDECLACVPPDDDFAQLRRVFLQKIDPLFPVVPHDVLEGTAKEKTSPEDVVLRQVVCLAAAADPAMAPYLRLRNRDSGRNALPRQTFSHTLSTAVRATLDTSLVRDRLVHIRCLVLLSLYAQPTCPDEADLPAALCSRAVHYVQTMGLHLLRVDDDDDDDNDAPSSSASRKDRTAEDGLVRLFCAVWALDRINGAMNGRPCLMHERDLGDKMERYIRRRGCAAPCFRLFLSVVSWLDRVTGLYRPGPSGEARDWEKIRVIDLPVLEAMIIEAGALAVPSPLLATIETFYHAVVILSCRLPRPVPSASAAPPATTTKDQRPRFPPPSANARRSLAADRVGQGVPRDRPSPLPFVPYAVSLALSVEYQKMRYCRLPMFRSRALAQFRSHCRLLAGYGEVFWNARVVSGLGHRVIREMERVVGENVGLGDDVQAPGAAAAGKPVSDGELLQQQLLLQDSQPEVRAEADRIVAGDGRVDGGVGREGHDVAHNGMGVNLGPVGQVSGEMPGFDMDMSLDVFGQFDPTFNLGAVDEVIENNLDIGLPLNWGDWEEFFATGTILPNESSTSHPFP